MLFHKKLILWYLENKRSMPWRETVDPYRIWLSEIILQQTRVAQGLPYYLSFTERYPTVFDLANAQQEEVLKLWQGLGYYSRARNLHETAQFVANELNGAFPDSYQELLKLKGIGDYTASAIASICYNEVVPVVDGNVYRVLSRYFNKDTPINSGKGIKEFKELANTLIDKNDPATYNQAIMEFGALQCKPQSPYCIICPLHDSCAALQKGMVATLPIKLKKGKVKNRYFSYLIFDINKNKTIIQQRTAKGIWQNLYEFPLIESATEIDVNAIIEDPIFVRMVDGIDYEITIYEEEYTVHKLSHQHLYTRFYIVKSHINPTISKEHQAVKIKDIEEYPVPTLLGNFIDRFY